MIDFVGFRSKLGFALLGLLSDSKGLLFFFQPSDGAVRADGTYEFVGHLHCSLVILEVNVFEDVEVQRLGVAA